jgi:hypothetical protein
VLLRTIEPRHIGPFAFPTTLHLDPEVTVLTGPNDTGKSCLLRIIRALCTRTALQERDINTYRIGEFSGPWQNDEEVGVTASFEITTYSVGKAGFTGNVQPGDVATFFFRLNRENAAWQLKELKRGDGRASGSLQRHPTVLSLPLDARLREVIDLSKMNPAERDFANLAFGGQFTIHQYLSLNEVARSFRVKEAEERLNLRLKQILPSSMSYRFSLREIAAKPNLLGIALLDDVLGHSPIESRGLGLQRILSVMGALLSVDTTTGHTYILFDEPELSLHADAQHALRRVLEELGGRPNVQVIYATHSPAMINTMRPGSIRVLCRERRDDKATTVIDNKPFVDNYFPVRSSLGITPADSLLYAPITIIVEGPTEVRCLPLLFARLKSVLGSKLDDLDLLLSQSHFLDGNGSSFEYMCRLATSQGARPIIFLDGDKQRDVARIRRETNDVPVITFAAGKEFEDAVPRESYISAVAKILGEGAADITVERFDKWLTSAALRPTVLFSKQVERWLRDAFDKPLNKPMVMEEALRQTPPETIPQEPFVSLLDAMRKALASAP